MAGETSASGAAELVRETGARAPHYRLRKWLALILVIVAVLAVIVSCVAIWAHRTVLDTDTYVATVAPLIKDPGVQHTLSTYVTDQVLTSTDLQNRIANVLPPRAAFLAGPIAVQIGDLTQRELQKVLASPQAEQAWIGINRVGHEQLVSALRGDNKFVLIDKNAVTLNLLPLVSLALERVQARLPTILGSRIQLPQIPADATPDQARAQLSAALGRPLPADFGTITLLKGDQGHQAQRAVGIFDKLVVVIVIVTVLLIAAAIVVSPRRWLTVLELALGVLLGVVITKVIVAQLTKALLNAIKKEGVVPVAQAMVDSVINGLGGFLAWLIAAGAIVAVGAFLATRPDWLEAAGRAVAKLLGAGKAADAPPSRSHRWVGAHLDLLRAGGVGVAVVVLLIAPKTWTWLLLAVLVLVAYELLLAVWALNTARATRSG
jgi:hypothetical protein